MRFVPGLLPISDTMVAWSASKFCKPQKWSKKRAKCSSQSLVTDHESLITDRYYFLPGLVSSGRGRSLYVLNSVKGRGSDGAYALNSRLASGRGEALRPSF